MNTDENINDLKIKNLVSKCNLHSRIVVELSEKHQNNTRKRKYENNLLNFKFLNLTLFRNSTENVDITLNNKVFKLKLI